MIRLNLTNSSLDGVTLFGIGDVPGAVEVADGQLGSVNLLDSRQSGAVDSSGRAVGSVLAKSSGGLAVVGYDPNCDEQAPGCHRARSLNDSSLRPGGGYSGAAISVSQEGDEFSRLAVHADGSIAWAQTHKQNGTNSTLVSGPGYDTILRRPIARAVQWAPAAAAKSYATRDVAVEGAEPGDAVSVGLGALGDAAALLSANVAADGRVRVLLQNVGAADLKLPESTLRVVVHQFV